MFTFESSKCRSKRRLLLTSKTMHPHRKESIPHCYYILTSYDSSTLTTTITMDDEEDEDAKTFYMASMFVIAESNLFASVIAKKRKVAPDHQDIYQTLRSKLYDRPVYMQSTWWIMLEKGDVKVVGHAHNKQFRQRFSVPFSIFKNIVEEARDWIGLNGKKLRDRVIDCVGVLGVLDNQRCNSLAVVLPVTSGR